MKKITLVILLLLLSLPIQSKTLKIFYKNGIFNDGDILIPQTAIILDVNCIRIEKKSGTASTVYFTYDNLKIGTDFNITTKNIAYQCQEPGQPIAKVTNLTLNTGNLGQSFQGIVKIIYYED